jgi:hypothetical protein
MHARTLIDVTVCQDRRAELIMQLDRMRCLHAIEIVELAKRRVVGTVATASATRS